MVPAARRRAELHHHHAGANQAVFFLNFLEFVNRA